MAGRKGRITIITLLVLVALFFSFCKPLLRATLPEVEDFTLTELVIKNDTAFVKLLLIVRNKGVWHIELQHVSLGVFDGDVQLMSYDNDSLQVLDRNELRSVELFCVIPINNVIQRIREHQGEDTVGLRLRGELVYSTFIGTSSSEVDRKIPVNVPIPPELFVRRIEYTGMEKGDYNLLFHVTLKNQNPRALEMKDVSYEMHGSKGVDLSGELNAFSIAALDSTLLTIPGRMTIDNRLLLISEILLDKDEMTYNFVMKGTIESLTGIAKQDVPVTINKNGRMELYNEDKDKRDRPKFSIRKKNR